MEAIKTYKSNPYFIIGDVKIPTWTTPLVLSIFTSVLIPNTSFLGHLSGLAVGYLCKSCSIHLLIRVANEYRGIRLYQVLGPTREDFALDRGKDESSWKVTTLCICWSEDIWKIWCLTYDDTNFVCWFPCSYDLCWKHTKVRTIVSLIWKYLLRNEEDVC